MRRYCDLEQLRTVYSLSDLCAFHTAMVEWDALQHDALTPAMILDEFLIRLGAVADTSGFSTFSTGLTRVTGLVTVAAAAMGGALAGMNRFVGSALSELNALTSASQRTGASLSFLQELGYAARLNGSSVEASTRSIESLSQK
ncbi:hypothetical protein [Xylella fastidiosa]